MGGDKYENNRFWEDLEVVRIVVIAKCLLVQILDGGVLCGVCVFYTCGFYPGKTVFSLIQENVHVILVGYA